MTAIQPLHTARNFRVSEELIATLAKRSDEKRADGAGREELSRAAAFALVQEGINPTVALVRRITNLGANDAIARDLEKIRGEMGEALRRRSLKTEVPEPLMGLVETMVDGLWGGALSEAQKTFDAERLEAFADRDKALERENLAKGLWEASQSEVQRLQTEVSFKDEAITSAESKCAALEATIQELMKSIDRLENELEWERQERNKERERAAADLQSTHKAHEGALAVVEGNRKYALLQLDSARSNERTLAERVKALEAEIHLRDSQNRLALNTLREHNSQVVMENGVLKGKLEARDEELIRTLARSRELENRLQLDADNQIFTSQRNLQEARNQTCAALATTAKNDPAIFEYCDLNECHVVVELSDTNVPAYTLHLDADSTKIPIPGTDLQSVIEFCKRHTD